MTYDRLCKSCTPAYISKIFNL